jgi:murein DD-endopeptidase MepM/ murein hydrolase activator NlpD
VITRQQDPKGSYGVYVVVQDQQGNRHFFSHLQGFYVSVGDSVAAGDLLGTSGTSGNSSGPHLHYEIRGAGGAQIDPTGLVSDGVVPGFPAMKPDQQQTIEEFNAEDEGFAFADLDPKGLRQATEDLLGTKIQPRLYAAVLSRGKMDEELTRARAQVVSERGIEGLAPEEDF